MGCFGQAIAIHPVHPLVQVGDLFRPAWIDNCLNLTLIELSVISLPVSSMFSNLYLRSLSKQRLCLMPHLAIIGIILTADQPSGR